MAIKVMRLAAIAAKNHRNGLDNPYAQLRKDLGFEFCRTGEYEEPHLWLRHLEDRLFALFQMAPQR